MKNTPAIQINPSLLLQSNETYHITIAEGAFTDIAGNRNEAFTLRFTTENRPIIISPPLPLPVIESEPGAPSQEPILQDPTPPSYYEPVFSAPTSQQQIQLDNQTTQVSDNILENELRNTTTDTVRLSVEDSKSKLGLSIKQLQKIVDANKKVQLKIRGVEFSIDPKDFIVDDNTDSFIIFGAEVLNQNDQDLVFNTANNKEQYLVLGNETLHLFVTLKDKEQETALQSFNNKIKVSLKLPKEAEHAARTGRLVMGRLNPETNEWEQYQGLYNKNTGSFEFETSQFSYWTYMVEKRSFSDISNHWAKEDIEYMANLGYVNGLDHNNFAPNQHMTRAQFAKIIADILDLSETSNLPFSDVKEAHWYYDSINKVYTAGIVNGMDAQSFAPNEIITREQMAVMLVKALKILEKQLEAIPTAEIEGISEVSSWAKESVEILVNAGVVNGKKLGNVNHVAPKDYLTRAEGIKLLLNLLNG